MNNLNYELNLYKKGFNYIAGVDEVGRGPLAGPMVTAAVILNRSDILELATLSKPEESLDEKYKYYSLINDSKKVSVKNRLLLDEFIKEIAISYSIQTIEHTLIDEKGITAATQIGFFNSVSQLSKNVQHILTDNFEIKALPKLKQTNIPKGDSNSITIAAASIIAKVYRDKIMENLDLKYPEYGFAKHKGYGTKYHIEMLSKHGPCEIHRKTFEPIKSSITRLKKL